MEFLTDFLTQYMPSAEIEWYLGFGILGTLICIALGAFVFETKKQARWIGALTGLVVAALILGLILLVRPKLVEGGFIGYSPGIMLSLSAISCLGVTLPVFLAVWLLLKEGKEKTNDNFFKHLNYIPIASHEAASSISSANETKSAYHQAPRPATGSIDKTGPNKDSIFISYRRDDSSEIVGRIYDHLVARFGKEAIFRDIEAIPLGVDFRVYLRTVVGNCGILLAVIGDRWLKMEDDEGKLRLSDPDDFVRIEIATALQREVPVVPVMIRNAEMPKPHQLPEDLAELAFRNHTKIRNDADFYTDMERLIQAIESHLNK